MKTRLTKEIEFTLAEQKDILVDRTKIYNYGFLKHGSLIKILFSELNELEKSTLMESEKFALINMIVAKLLRYCENVKNGHRDSLIDLSNYAILLAAYESSNNLNEKIK